MGFDSIDKWQFAFLRIATIVILVIFIQFTNIISWHVIMKSLGVKLGFKKNSRIWVSNLSRLLPGTVWQYVSRIYLLSKEDVAKSKALTALDIEGFLNIAIGSIIAVLVISFFGLPVQKTVLNAIILLQQAQ